MSLISPDIFEGEIHIAQLSQLPVQENVQLFIDKYEPKLLRKLLGNDMYQDLAAGMLLNPVPAKWASLKDGGVFDSGTEYFDGLAILIANYTYWYYMFDYNVQTVQVGAAKPKSENAVPASPVHKMVRAWNEFVDMTCQMHRYIRDNVAEYPDYIHKDRSSICSDYTSGCGCGGQPLYRHKNSLGI